ncbi:MAG: acyl-CoA dehydrogenase family protein [Proteobacteria bacterium]|nr:acyl-CoA dehydrogenase family protein [Pseudomonadota bacterium]
MPDTTAVTAASGLKSRAAALEPSLAARAQATEQLRRIPDETIADLKAAGLHRICQPARFGGAEAPLDAACDIVAALARGCSSTGWVAGVYTDHQILIGMFDDRAADAVRAENPDALVSAGFTPGGKHERVDGGWRVSGSWEWSSGCDHADWLIVGVLLPTGPDGAIEPNYCIVSRDDVVIEDNWHVMGLAGTGSKNLHVESAVVPDYRALPFRMAGAGGAARGQTDAPALYRLPHPPCVPFLLAVPSLGIAESLLDAVVEQMAGRSSRGVRVAEHQTLQVHIAEAAAQIDAARLLVMRDTGEAMAAMHARRELTLLERARNRRDHAYVVRECRAAVDRLFTTLGGQGIFLDNALQRKFRDMHAMSGHFALNWDIAATTYGQVALGIDPQTNLK